MKESVFTKLVEKIHRWPRQKSCLLVGIAGAPGCGKSTLAEQLVDALPFKNDYVNECVSIDDFYYTPEERKRRGYKWRALPGTHDLSLLQSFLEQLRENIPPLKIPRYNRAKEEKDSPKHIQSSLDVCIIEGWFVGAPVEGYTELANALDCLIYMDMSLEDAYKCRIERERKVRAQNSGGLSEEETIAFWKEALEPGIRQLVFPLRSKADFVLSLDENHTLTELA